jgi:hypothetical protein
MVKSADFYNKAMVQIKPAYKNYITQTAKALSHKKLNTDSLKLTMKTPGNSMFSNVTDLDISTLIQLVMQEMATENAADIKSITEKIAAINKEREALRKEEERIREAAKKTEYSDTKNKTTEMEQDRQQKETTRKTIDSSKIKSIAYTAAQAKRLAEIKDEKDAISDMGELDNLQLQLLLEKKKKLEEMISNMMKAMGDTQNTISSNLKG